MLPKPEDDEVLEQVLEDERQAALQEFREHVEATAQGLEPAEL